MSYWTEVRGIVMIRTMWETETLHIQLRDIFGIPTYRPDDYSQMTPEEEAKYEWSWANCSVPRGSEGSLDYHFDPHTDSIIIQGNLRDYGEDQKEIDSIVSWLESSLKRLNLAHPPEVGGPTWHVDSALLQINRSRDPSEIWSWSPRWKNSGLIKVGTLDNVF